MKKSKKSNIVIVLVVLLLVLAVGYAAFSTNLTITGTATTKTGNWDVRFTNANITQSELEGTFEENKAIVSADGKTVDVDAFLQAPGDGANVTATITNNGNLDALLQSFEVSGMTQNGNVYTDGDIIVTVPTVDATNGNIPAKSTGEFKFSIEWDKDATNIETKEASFDITFTYVQGGVQFTGVQSFNVN